MLFNKIDIPSENCPFCNSTLEKSHFPNKFYSYSCNHCNNYRACYDEWFECVYIFCVFDNIQIKTTFKTTKIQTAIYIDSKKSNLFDYVNYNYTRDECLIQDLYNPKESFDKIKNLLLFI
jgi:hypothetical protein